MLITGIEHNDGTRQLRYGLVKLNDSRCVTTQVTQDEFEEIQKMEMEKIKVIIDKILRYEM